MEQKNKKLISVTDHIDDYSVDIEIVESFKEEFEKMKEQQDIDEFYLIGNITALGSEKIIKYIEGNGTVIIHDQNKNLILIFKFNSDKIKLIDITDAENFVNINKFTIKTLKELLE